MSGVGSRNRALVHHQAGAADALPHRALLGRLEQQLDRAGQAGALGREHLGRRHQDRHVAIVAAGMHHPRPSWPPQAARAFEAKGRSTSSRTGSASMSALSATTGPGPPPPFSTATSPVRPDAFLHLVAEAAQVPGDQGGGAVLAVAEFRVGVDVAPPGDHRRLDLAGRGVEVGVDRPGGRRAPGLRRGRPRQEGQGCAGAGAHEQGSPPRRDAVPGDALRPKSPRGAQADAKHDGSPWSRHARGDAVGLARR